MPERFSPAQPNYLRFVSTPTIDIEPVFFGGAKKKRLCPNQFAGTETVKFQISAVPPGLTHLRPLIAY